MGAEDFLLDAQVRQWLDGIEPAWTLLTFESLRALRREPSAGRTAIRIANDLSVEEIAGSPFARNTLILLQQTIERGGLSLTATGNLSRAVVADMRKLIDWPDYDQAEAFQFNKVINEPAAIACRSPACPRSNWRAVSTRPSTRDHRSSRPGSTMPTGPPHCRHRLRSGKHR
jgi:hypothetical protein